MINPDLLCPCGTGHAYSACCGLYSDHGNQPETAERLMRSRYTAYVLAREDYLLRTWHASTRPAILDLDAAGSAKWLGLKIVRAEAGGTDDSAGMVEFVARFKVNGKAERLHETSRFIREYGEWFYLDGTIASP